MLSHLLAESFVSAEGLLIARCAAELLPDYCLQDFSHVQLALCTLSEAVRSQTNIFS